MSVSEDSMQIRRVLCALALFAGAAVAYAGDMIDNPEYKNWSHCKAGSWVTYEMVASGNKSSMTYKLLEISADKAVVETSMPPTKVGDKEYPIPATKRDVPAKVEKPKDEGAKGEKAKEGDEEIELGGKKVKAHFMEMKDSKVWYSDEIPGKLAKSKTSASEMSAVKWEKK
jgi:hypothetical protein